MNKEAIEKFLAQANENDDLRGKVAALQKKAATEGNPVALAEGLAALSATAGVPVPAADWLAFLKKRSAGTLDDGELEKVAGGLQFSAPKIENQKR